MSLIDAANCLDELSVGRTPDQDRLIAGTLALHALHRRGQAGRDMLVAYPLLETLATGRSNVLDEAAQAHALCSPRWYERLPRMSQIQTAGVGKELVGPVSGRRLTAARFQGLVDVPSELEWFANIDNASTRRAYENALQDFMRFTGIAQPGEFRIVTRSHVIAWRDDWSAAA